MHVAGDVLADDVTSRPAQKWKQDFWLLPAGSTTSLPQRGGDGVSYARGLSVGESSIRDDHMHPVRLTACVLGPKVLQRRAAL